MSGIENRYRAKAECQLLLRKETIAGMRRNRRDAPIPAVRGTKLERQGSSRVIRRLPVTWQYGALGGRRLISLEGIECTDPPYGSEADTRYLLSQTSSIRQPL